MKNYIKMFSIFVTFRKGQNANLAKMFSNFVHEKVVKQLAKTLKKT